MSDIEECSHFEEIEFKNLRSIANDLSIDDFDDVDLSDVTEEKSLHHSIFNQRYKKQKVLMTDTQLTEHIRKISPDMIQLDLTRNMNAARLRPQTLNLFSESDDIIIQEKTTNIDKTDSNVGLKDTSRGQVSMVITKFRNSNIKTTQKQDVRQRKKLWIRNPSEWSTKDIESVEYCRFNGEMLEQTHVATFKFIRRHSDEMNLQIYDPIHVETQSDDLWYSGINMRTGEQGVFPCYYAQNVGKSLDELSAPKDDTFNKFYLYFIGSVEIPCHKGIDILCQAMYKVADARKKSSYCAPPAYVCLIVDNRGVKMIDQSDIKKRTEGKYSKKHLKRTFSSSEKLKENTHLFQLKNVSFCGHHPHNQKYFGFIVRHPTEYRFACLTFVSHHSTKRLVQCFGDAFSQYVDDYMEHVQPCDDMYLE